MYKPTYVQVVQVTDDNMAEVAAWCDGKITHVPARTPEDGPSTFIKVTVPTAVNERQTQAFKGDFVIKTERHGFKVFTFKALHKTFDRVTVDSTSDSDNSVTPAPVVSAAQ
jgi:hypothetical protein